MKQAIKYFAMKIPGLYRAARYLDRQTYFARHNLRDAIDSYIAPALKSKRCHLGFAFGGLNSQHHKAMQDGTFEPDEVRLLQHVLPKVAAFIDVGANAGYYTCLARQLGTYTIAVEPMPNNLRCLMQNLLSNSWGDTEIVAAGVADKIGIATLFGASSTGASLIDNWAGASARFRRSIPTSTIDTIIGRRFSDCRLLIKVDIEGFEYQALVGATEILERRVKPLWLIEISHHQYHPGGRNPHFVATFELMWTHGYACLLLDCGRFKAIQHTDVVRWETQGHTDTPAINYVFVPLDARDLVEGALPSGTAPF